MLDILIILTIIVTALLFAGATAYVYKKNVHIWLKQYIVRNLRGIEAHDGPTDIMFLFVDHFELNGHADRLDAWQNRYPAMAAKHRDADGQHPKHSFYYAMDLMHEHELEALAPLVEQGFGEFELHWHHSHDTSESFVQKITDIMPTFHKYNMMKPVNAGEVACFSFIHGNWSLANSRGAEFCGVDDEITLLKQLGCYGDYTFPALFSPAQPAQVNEIYYCTDKTEHKPYNTGRTSTVGTRPSDNEFMIFNGPLSVNFKDWRHKWHPTIEDGDINHMPTQGDPKRVDAWVRQAIHVKGNSQWQFVKIFCHGAQDHKSVVGPATDAMFTYLEQKYNDGKKYRLHYVTAREAYNIVRAAEDGKTGNPNDFRDYEIPHPLNR